MESVALELEGPRITESGGRAGLDLAARRETEHDVPRLAC